MSKAPLVSRLTGWIPGQTATTAADQVIARAPFSGTITKCSLIPEAAVTGETDTARTFTLVNKGQAGAGTGVAATLALIDGVNLVAFDEKLFTLATVSSLVTVAEGDILAIAEADVGAGLAHSGGEIVLEISRL